MDTFSHGFWVGAIYKVLGRKINKKFNIWLAVWWGIFPDILSFTISSVWLLWVLLAGQSSLAELPRPDTIREIDAPFVYAITLILYNLSHSLIVFLLVAVLVTLAVKRIAWEMFGWLLHILMDMPTHALDFWPTPVLWPLFDWQLPGFNWEIKPWFWLINYLAIILVFLWFKFKKS